MSSKTDATVAGRLRRLVASGLPKYLGDLVVLASGQLASKLIGFVVFAVLARRLEPADYGSVEYIIGLAAFFAVAVDCGLGTIGVRRMGASPGKLPALAAQVPAARFLIALLAAPLMVAGMTYFGPPGLPSALTWLIAATLLLAPWNGEWLLQGCGMMRQVAIAQTIRALVSAGVVLLLVRGPADTVTVGWAELAAALTVTAYYVGQQQWKITPLRLGLEISRLAGLAREGLSVGLANFVWSAAQYLPLFLVGSLIGGADVGWFGAAQRLALSIAAFSLVYHFNLFPALTRASATSDQALAQLLLRSFRVTAWATIGLALGVTLGATPIVEFVFGERFAEAAPALAVMIWIIPVTILSGHSRWTLIVKGAPVGVLHAQIAGLVTVAVLGVPLVHFFGANGAALAAVLASFAVWAVAHARMLHMASLPALSLAFRPALLALVLWAALQWLPASPITGSFIGLGMYGVLAPLIDRRLPGDFLALAHSS